MNEEQITMILETLNVAPYEVGSFMMESINYFDRYNLENRLITGKRRFLKKEGILNGRYLSENDKSSNRK